MSWHTWHSRVKGVPLSILLILSGSAFLLGVVTSIFVWEVFQLRFSVPDRNADPHFSLLPVDFVTFPDKCLTEWEEVPGERVRQLILDRVFDGVSPYEGFPSNETAPLLRKHRIKGWGANATVFERLIREVRPVVILEIGSFLGASAMHMGKIARNLSLAPIILGVDDFRGWPGFRDKKFKDIKIHNDLNLAHAILKPGGVMFGHDYFNRGNGEGVRRAVDIFARFNNLKVEPDGQHWILRNSSYSFPEDSSDILRLKSGHH